MKLIFTLTDGSKREFEGDRLIKLHSRNLKYLRILKRDCNTNILLGEVKKSEIASLDIEK